MEYLPILSATYWANEISRVLDENVSYDGRKAVAAAGYDIVEESKNLLEYYTEVNEK